MTNRLQRGTIQQIVAFCFISHSIKQIVTGDDNIMKADRTIYYSSYTDDVVKSHNQSFKLKTNYEWINNSLLFKMASMVIYVLAIVIGYICCKLFFNISYKNRKLLKKCKKDGYFVYANHTQPVGDVVIPALACVGKRVYVIVSQANYGIPVIGKILPELGALPVPDSISQYKKFTEAYKKHIEQGHPVIIYPEAHVWPYYTQIRPFEKTSFRFPAELNKPVYVMTTTYTHRHFLKNIIKRPKVNVYIDGPFYPDTGAGIKDNQKMLHDRVYEVMKSRSHLSDYEYIRYERKNVM